MRFPLRRILLGFTVGAAAGWAAGLFRTPKPAPVGSSAWESERLPQENFGDAPGETEAPPPAKAVPPKAPAKKPPTKPAAAKPAAKPAPTKPAAKKSVAKKPVAKKPVAKKPATRPAKPAKPPEA